MAYEFNAFAAPLTNTPAMISFAANGDMPAGYEVRLIGTGLAYDNATGTMSGTITEIQLYDPAFGATGGARQTISIAAADQTTLAGSISAFLGSGLQLMADTFAAWDLVGDGFHHLGNVVFDPGGLSVRLELMDSTNTRIGYLLVEGTNLTDTTFSQTGTITKITNLDIDAVAIPGEEVTYSPGKSAAAFEYGVLSRGLPDPDGGLIGNDEVLYPVLVSGDSTITRNDEITGYVPVEGGAGNDTFISTTGGHLFYTSATSGVNVSLVAGQATGGAGTDTFNSTSFGAVTGSNFNDTLQGGLFNSWLRGAAGADNLFGLEFHDTLEGGDGNDELSGNNGDDWLFGGLGDDAIHGGQQDGDNFGDAGDGTDDILFYSLLGVTSGSISILPFGVGLGARDYLTGITVTFLNSDSGTVTGGAGNDTFDGIEEVWGSRYADTFNFSNISNSSVSGFGGGDTFTGGTGIDQVNYDAEIFDDRNAPGALNGTFTTGVFVNMSNVAHTIGGTTVSEGQALDSFGDTDTFTGGIEIVSGTQYNDALIGNALNNELYGREGADILVGGAGNDKLSTGSPNDVDGGTASDLVDYRRDGGASGITVTVVANDDFTTVTDTHGNTDTIFGYVNVIGTNQRDIFTGNAFTNRFTPGRGNDTVTSGGGGTGLGGDQLSYLFEDDATLGIDYDATRTSGQIKTNDATDTYWGTDTLVGFTSIWLEATQNNDILKGGAGNDVFLASRGTDTIDGRGGRDTISYVDFRTTLQGDGLIIEATTSTSGTVTDSELNVDTYQNIEALGGSMYADTFDGSTGNDMFLGHGGNDMFTGNGGSDTVDYRYDADLAQALGIDLERLAEGWTPLNPPAPHGIIADLEAGTVIGIFENLNTSIPDEDTDILVGIDNIIGSAFRDDISGNQFNNRLDGYTGNDILRGFDGDDTYVVDSTLDSVQEAVDGGTDTVESSVSITLALNVENLVLTGSALTGTGNSARNTITGNNQNNTLNGGTGLVDTLIGGLGNDTYKVKLGDQITERAGQGTADRVQASASYSLSSINNDIEFLETISSTGLTRIDLTGNGIARQTITGNNGINTINGLGGIDIINGLNGNDIINGGLGNDQLRGGANNDTFIFNTALSTTANRDIIFDFFAPQDTIKLENTGVFTALGATLGTLSANKFWASNTGVAHDLDDRIIYNKLTGVLTYDSNGSAAGGAVQFAVLSTKPAVTNADFIII